MPYYEDRFPLSPLPSEVVTTDRIERLLTASVIGSSGVSGTPSFSIRQKEVEAYKGFYVARSIEIRGEDDDDVTYVLMLVGGMVDARFFERGSRKSPWIEIEGRPPTLAEIQSYWRPVTEPAMQKRVETAFLAVERHITRHHMADATEEHKLQHVSRQELDWNSLGQFCTVLGGSTKETRAFIDDHLMFAAYNPQNYLRTHGLLDNMTLDDCREFTWLSLLMDSDSHFYRSHHICVVDWKTEGDEVEFCINRLLKTERPDTEDRVDLGGDGVMSATDDWLAKASGQLERLALQILLIDSGGDNYVFTLADSRKAKRLVSLGKMIGLVVDVFPSPQAGGKGWFGRIMTMFSR